MKIPVFGLVMIFVIWLAYELKKHTREENQTRKDFWERERQSGFIPRKSTNDIHYITITEQFLPEDRGTEDSELFTVCSRILQFKDKPVADLSEYSNTELKEKYGTANFTSLSEADSNFTFLVPYFGDLCRLLYADGRLAEAERAALFFTENGEEYPIPEDERRRFDLYRLFEEQRVYYREHGRFCADADALCAAEGVETRPVIETTAHFFEMRVKRANGNGEIRLFADGRSEMT